MSGAMVSGPTYDNPGFQRDERPPPYAPRLPPQIPSYVAAAPETVDTHRSTAPGPERGRAQKSAGRSCPWRNILCASVCLLLVLVVLSLLLWYFLAYQCALGRSCSDGGPCLSATQWCDGVQDCPGGQDESQCFRLHGPEPVLQWYSSSGAAWMPVCAEEWDDNYGRDACEQIGFRRQDYVTSKATSAGHLASEGYVKLKRRGVHVRPSLYQPTHSHSCPGGAVQLLCIGCGESSRGPRSRIVGGNEAVNEAWPWQVSLQVTGRHVCGGSVIDRLWILSAAHCFQTLSNPREWTVRSGDVSLLKMSFDAGHGVLKVIVHRQYDPETNDNDVALLKLDRPLRFSSAVKPVCLPNVGVEISEGNRAWITGWGALRSSGPSPDRLNQAEVTVYSRETCNRPQVLNAQVTESMICAGKLQGGVDSCQGDSGGPLVVRRAGVWWLLGDTSWGIGCAWRNKPGVYGNVAHFRDWIREQMQIN